MLLSKWFENEIKKLGFIVHNNGSSLEIVKTGASNTIYWDVVDFDLACNQVTTLHWIIDERTEKQVFESYDAKKIVEFLKNNK